MRRLLRPYEDWYAASSVGTLQIDDSVADEPYRVVRTQPGIR